MAFCFLLAWCRVALLPTPFGHGGLPLRCLEWPIEYASDKKQRQEETRCWEGAESGEADLPRHDGNRPSAVNEVSAGSHGSITQIAFVCALLHFTCASLVNDRGQYQNSQRLLESFSVYMYHRLSGYHHLSERHSPPNHFLPGQESRKYIQSIMPNYHRASFE